MKTFHPLLLALLILPLLSACATPSQILADAKVKRLCEKDGGITVYETVTLPAERFDKYGRIAVPDKKNVKPTDEYFYDYFSNNLDKGNPKMRQYRYKVYRQNDRKLLGETIIYSRIGGDIPGPWHPSSRRCPEEAGLYDLTKKIFIME